MKIYIFSWNTQTVSFDKNNTNFIPILVDNIERTGADIVAIGLQEDSIRESELLVYNDLITKELGRYYHKIALEELSGWGVTTYKALREEWKYAPRGLRLAVYRRGDSDIIVDDIRMTSVICPGIREKITAGKGCVAVSLATNVGEITFLNMHLPFNSRSIIQDPNEIISSRHTAVLWQAMCLKTMWGTVTDLYRPDYAFVMGDLNFRVQIRGETDAEEIAKRILVDSEYLKELIVEADELYLLTQYSREQLEPTVPILSEGIAGIGPKFLPTCKLEQGRTETIYKLGSIKQRTPSWCDRILYQGDIKCTSYNCMDFGDMNLSDHAGVIGEYILH